jgi:hypothetical protein
LRYEAECLTSQHTKQNLRGQPIANPRSKPPLPRERFSPTTLSCQSRTAAFRKYGPPIRDRRHPLVMCRFSPSAHPTAAGKSSHTLHSGLLSDSNSLRPVVNVRPGKPVQLPFSVRHRNFERWLSNADHVGAPQRAPASARKHAAARIQAISGSIDEPIDCRLRCATCPDPRRPKRLWPVTRIPA